MHGGWIRVYRKFTQWEWYSDIKVARLFLHLLLTVNHTAVKWQGIEIQPGQRVTSREKLAEETGLGVQEVRTALNKLKSTNEITVQPTSRYTLISIVNWRKYQNIDFETNPMINLNTNHKITSVQPTINQQVTTNNNDNNNKNEKNEKNIYNLTSFSNDVENFSTSQQKHCFGKYKNVFLTDSDISQLKAKFGNSYIEKIDALSEGMELKGYKYNNHYLAIIRWFGTGFTLKPEEDVLLANMDVVPVFGE